MSPLSRSAFSALRMSETEAPKASTSLIPVDIENIGTAAGITGGILGFVLAGPIAGLILAAIAKYVTKKENESGEALRGVGKTVIESYNFLLKLNGKYDLTSKASETIVKAVSSLPVETDGLEKVKETVSSTVSKVQELNKEYDLVSKGKQALVVAATLSDSALEKVEELNAKVIKMPLCITF